MTPHEAYEFVEHFLLMVLLVAVTLYLVHAVVVYILRRLKAHYRKPANSSILSDATLSLKLAISLQANAQAFYDELMGGAE